MRTTGCSYFHLLWRPLGRSQSHDRGVGGVNSNGREAGAQFFRLVRHNCGDLVGDTELDMLPISNYWPILEVFAGELDRAGTQF